MSICRRTIIALTTAVALTLSATMAWAGPHDLQLSRFLDFEVDDDVPSEIDNPRAQDHVWGQATGDDEAFSDLTRDLGQVTAPRIAAPSETLGQAGFAVKLMTSLSDIPNQEDYWQRGAEGGTPESMLFTSHLQVRKGLPFSFEIAGNLSHLAASEMFIMGADLRWALHEGYDYFPDVGIRASGNTITGAPELNLINASWDISMSKSFGLGGVTQLTPYLGYQQLYTIASSRVLNAQPQDPRPPRSTTFNYEDANGNDREYTANFAPEYVFSQQVHTTNRFFGGLRLNTWIMSFTLEAIIGETVNQFTLAGGVDF